MSCELDRRAFLAAASCLAAGPRFSPSRPGDMPADAPRALEETGADLATLFADVEHLTSEGEYPLSFLSDRFQELAAHQAVARSRVFDLLAYSPKKVAPRAEVIDRADRGDHVREKVLFSTSPQLRVPAYVLVPKRANGPMPAIVDLHSHGGMFLFGKEKVIDFGTNHPTMTEYHRRNYDGRPTATELVKRGYVVITIDALMFGERRVMSDADRGLGWDRSKYGPEEVAKLNQVCRSKEATIVKGLAFGGMNWPGVVFWDDIRTVDYLVTRPEVDRERIGCLGISMGGYRSIFLAALDPRIKAAVVAGFMSTVRPMLRAHLDTHSFVHYLPGLHHHLDWPDVAGLTAPRALLVLQCSQDGLFPLTGMTESVNKIARIYQKADCADQFRGAFHDVPHQFTRAMQDEAFAWFDRQLKPGA